MLDAFFKNSNYFIFKASCHYFSSYSELTSSETSNKTKLEAALKIASYASLIFPIFLGLFYIANKRLCNRAKKLELKREGNLQGILNKINVSPTKAALKTNHVGAGILPYCTKEDGSTYFLMAKEAKGYAKGTWCDFGGGADPGETRIVTAVREGWEESCDILGSKKKIYKNIHQHNPLTADSGDQAYAMFLMKVEAANIDIKKFYTKTPTNPCLIEKSELAWVKAQDLLHAVRHNDKCVIAAGKTIKLRKCFFETFRHALKEEQQLNLLKSIIGEEIKAAS